MALRPGKVAPRHKMPGGQPTRKVPAAPYSFPAPIRGLILNENTATPTPASARVLDNWVCTTTGIRPRGGSTKFATVAAAPKRLVKYNSGLTEKLFAATETAVYDITTPADPDVSPSASVSSLTNGDWSVQQFGTVSGNYVYMCNGADDPLLYDGTSFTAVNGASSPAITGVTTSGLSFVWSFKSRLFFVEDGTMSAHYLPIDAIGGAIGTISLAGIFKEGGALLFGATWSNNAGEELADRCVFVSTEGEVAVYTGTDPSNASTFSLSGVYQLPRPIGPEGHTQIGGELLIATEVGLFPLSAAITGDVSEMSNSAASQNIAPLWQDRSTKLSSDRWEIERLSQGNLMVVSQPGGDGLLCMNQQTFAWTRWTGINVECMAEFQGLGVYGAADGSVSYMDNGGSDNGSIYTARYLGQFDPMGHYGATKTITQARPVFRSSSDINPSLVFKSDFDEEAGAPPSSPVDRGGDSWDSGLWDVALWDATVPAPVTGSSWRSAGETGEFIAPDLKLSFGVTAKPDVELVVIDTMYTVGGVVT